LIDEYDKPMLNNLSKAPLAEIKQVMNAFYSAVKSQDEHLKFVFITGVSKFAKVSVFSGMNSLTDISMNQDYATIICGITEQELQSNFNDAIDQLTRIKDEDTGQPHTRQSLLRKIKYWYNGYRFHHAAPGVYNPYSVLSLFRHREFDHYWFATATPTFLIDMIKTQQFDLGACPIIGLDRHMVRDRSPASTKIVVNKANSFGFSHSKAKGFNAVYGHFRLVLGNV
jgi:hypothetical protein